MKLRELFLKDIERDIRGVIKVAQTSEDDIETELEEYVVTQELHKHYSKFYENYQKSINGKTDKMGVWISGFFGSGKSHLLKILAYLLGNKEVKGRKPVDFFEEKIKDPLVYANMKRAAEVETEVILFNIDSKSPLNNKSKEDAILRVFLKVFNEHRGYYGEHLGIAEMEKYLDKQGVFDDFKREFKALSGESWEDRRNTFHFDADYVIGALTKATNMSEESARNWFERGVHNVEVSIDKFAREVKEYIDSKGKNFHLIFLVDEIGQYIGDSRDLMLNLQTITEDLGTYCEGKVWIIVTAQESIDSLIKVKGDDFSRIQGRFDTRLSLSSISVDEVIKKRVLEKKDYVYDRLKLLYHEKSAILKNLISFRDSTADLRGYESDREFAEVYPFIPYQFKLLQNVFEQVRKHGSSGKHLSEGERSMLSAFKEAALQYKDKEEGTLIPFYAFYDTIREFLTPSVARVIEGAYQNSALNDDEFNINLLKVLFMIKYIKEFPANIDNLATLMITHVDEDKLQLKEKIQVALRKLISQTLIQKHGDEYIFLTDDEQDINREIKQVSIEEDKVKRELAEYIFQDIYDVKRYMYNREYSFPFNQKMDEKNYGSQTANIGIQILSPLSEHYHKSEQELMMMSSGSGEMIIKLEGNESYVEEMEEALKIETYRGRKNPLEFPENIQNILNNKQVEARERRRRVRELLEDAIKEGIFYINGEKAEIKGSTAKEKINNGFALLVENVYTKLHYINKHIENGQELKTILTASDDQIILDESLKTKPNELAKQEIYDFINLQNEIKKQVRVKILYDRFSDKPYGWKTLDIAALIAELLKEQRIRIRYNAEYLEPETDANTLMTVFTKLQEADRAIIIKREKVDESLIRAARRVCRDVFNQSDLAIDEDGLIKDIRGLIDKQVDEICAYKNRYEGRPYPGESILDKGLEYFNQFDKSIDNVTFFTRLKDLEEDLSYWVEDVELVKHFFSNQKDIFDEGLATLEKYEEMEAYFSSDELRDAMERLKEIVENPIPYREIKDIPELVNSFEKELEKVLAEKVANAKQKIQLDYEEISLIASQYGVSKETRERVENFYQQLNDSLETYNDVFKVDATISQSTSFKERTARVIKREIEAWRRRKEEDERKIIGEPPTPHVETQPVVQKEKVKLTELVQVKTLSSEEEVDKYIHTLSKKLKQIIRANKQIEFVE